MEQAKAEHEARTRQVEAQFREKEAKLQNTLRKTME
jgi:hypothetical protein